VYQISEQKKFVTEQFLASQVTKMGCGYSGTSIRFRNSFLTLLGRTSVCVAVCCSVLQYFSTLIPPDPINHLRSLTPKPISKHNDTRFFKITDTQGKKKGKKKDRKLRVNADERTRHTSKSVSLAFFFFG